jgi:hypothetical protein
MSLAEDFSRQKYVVAEGLLNPNLVKFLQSYYLHILKGRTHFERDGTSLNGYGEACADAVLYGTTEKIEKVTGLQLNPGFSFVRLYRKGDLLRKHIDRGANEINCTIQIYAPTPWPLVAEVDGKEVTVNQNCGDAFIYHGLEIPHWRDKYAGKEHLQLILAHVIKGGVHDELCSFDGRGQPEYAPGAHRWSMKKKLEKKLMGAGADLKRKLRG